jgi:hypothetical protein
VSALVAAGALAVIAVAVFGVPPGSLLLVGLFLLCLLIKMGMMMRQFVQG